MVERGKGSIEASRFDDFLREYLERQKGVENIVNAAMPEDSIDCCFKNRCYAFKSSTGDCPCELQR